jgi:Family of unknown function (DUF6339)
MKQTKMRTRLFRQAELSALYSSVEANLDRYRSGDFAYMEADSSYFFEIDVEFDQAALGSMKEPTRNEDEDIDNFALFYKALPLTPYEAREERLWTYMSHIYLLSYARARWPIPVDDKDAVAHIRTHFFARTKRQIERDNVASRLWWMAHLCNRVSSMSLTDALKILLHQSDVRANLIERPTLSRSATVFSSILELLGESFAGENALFNRTTFREFMKRLNDHGGYVLLDVLEPKSLKEILSGIIVGQLKVDKL